jgi:hypothetical protein
MADTLKRIFGPSNIPAGANTLFTGTASHVYTIKSITILNPTARAISVKLGMNGITDDKLFLPWVEIAAGGMGEYHGLKVMSGTETIQANATLSGLTISVSGLDQG